MVPLCTLTVVVGLCFLLEGLHFKPGEVCTVTKEHAENVWGEREQV